MENITKNTMLLFACFLAMLAQYSHAHQSAPALYVFGDSILDPGNNNRANNTNAKANHAPYGIDFPGGATGRFSNGKTIADIFADLLNIPTPHRISGFNNKTVQVTGFNYASASSGILDITGKPSSGGNLNLKKQVEMFRINTVQNYLPLHLKSEQELATHLSKSIFLLITGSNDYGLNFLDPNPAYKASKTYNPLTFADHLLTNLGNRLQDLYKLGARKFVVYEIAPLGCWPAAVAMAKPSTRCVDPLNQLVLPFNMKLPIKLNELSSTLKGSTFVVAKSYQLMYDIILKPTSYGFTDSTSICCPNFCQPGDVPCKDRKTQVFWDIAHPTEAVAKLAAEKCFEQNGICSPMSLRELALKK